MKKYLFLFFLLITSITTCLSQTRYYVSAAGSPTGDALSWTTACNDLQLVINNAAPYDTIWVAQGTYVPIRPADSLWKIDSNNRDNAFTITKGLCLYGGFTGTETELSQRNMPIQGSNGLTVLSGDIGTPNDKTDNAYHVVIIATQQDTVSLNGFTITAGSANVGIMTSININGRIIQDNSGGGIYNASFLISSYLSITNNDALHGGGIYNPDTTFLQLNHSIVSENQGVYGAGICTKKGYMYISNTTIKHNSFRKNSYGLFGGGIWINGPRICILTNVSITDNQALYGGGIDMALDTMTAISIVWNNVLIANNEASWGGGIHVSLCLANVFAITNCTFVNNITNGNTASIYFHSSTDLKPVHIRNSIIWGNKSWDFFKKEFHDCNLEDKITNLVNDTLFIYSHCLSGRTVYLDIYSVNWIELPTPPGAIIADPLFVDTANRDYRLQCGSPAVNMGENAFYHPDSFPNLSHIITDIDGNSRFFNQDIDLGAYELQEPCAPFIWVADTVFTCFKDSTEIHIRLSGTAPWNLVYTSNNGQSYDTLKNIWNNNYILKLYTTDTLSVQFPYIQDALFDNVLSENVFVAILYPPILTSVLKNDTLCSGEQTKAVVFAGTANDYQWEAKGDTINYIPNDVQTGDFGSYKVENTDTFPLSTTITVMPYVTVSNKTCYGKIDSFSITVRPVIQLEAGVNDSLFCEGDSILFVLFNTDVTNVTWQGNETILDEKNAVIPDAKPAHSGMYIVRARKANYCILPDTIQITVLSAVITDMDDTLFMCDWEDITIYSNATNANDYLWNTGEASANINVSNPGTYYLEATNERCIVFDTVEVIQIQVSEFTISPSGDLCDGKEVELTATIDNVSYQWNTGDTSKTIIVSVEGFYSVTIEAGHCQAYKELEINCPCKIVLPNAFTPVQGRTYLPIVDFTLNSYSMLIYNRWGNIVFETNSLSPWDGTNKGKPVSDGVYYCVVSYTCTDMPDKILTTQSSITVMR